MTTGFVTLAPKTIHSTYSLRQIIEEATWRARKAGTILKRPYMVSATEVTGEWIITVAVSPITEAADDGETAARKAS